MNEKLINFVIQNTHFKKEQITPELSLAGDIGLFELDAYGFMEDFFNEFDVSKVEDFDSKKYINDGFISFKLLENIFSKKKIKLNPDITLKHLDDVINKGEWFNV